MSFPTILDGFGEWYGSYFGTLLETEAFHLENLGEKQRAKRCWIIGSRVWNALQDPEQSQILLKRANRTKKK